MTEAYEGWAIVEQMGFRRTVARVQEIEMYGAKMLRLDIPVGNALDGDFQTRFAGGPSLYQVTPISEAVAKYEIERQSDPRPVMPVEFRIEDKTDGDGDLPYQEYDRD